VTGHHPVTTTTELPMFPALSRLERMPELQPRKFNREPFWRAPITPASRDCYVPTWNWHSFHEVPEDAERLILDANGAYIGAAGGVKIAHSHLTHTGPLEHLEPRDVDPGYYLITVPYWAFGGTIVSPLGDSSRLETEPTMWIAHPTLILLLELLEFGAIAEVTILDSWTARTTTDFKKWVAHLKEVRAEILDALGQAQTDAAQEALLDKYDRFKEGYSAALSMMLTGEKCKTRRPDWVHAVYAQHAATQWRKGWRWTETGRPLLSMGHVDEIEVLAEDLPVVMSRPKPPFRFDDSGRTIGAMKTKAPSDDTTPAAPALVALPGEDIL
jgi:hypothetical protein